jgi:hypothetical protein
MRAIWICLAAYVALAVGFGPSAWAQARDVPFTCEIDLNQVRPADRSNIPLAFRQNSYLTTGEKKCTGGGSQVIQIRCTTRVTGWTNPRNQTIKNFVEPCQFLEGECGTPDRRRIANNQTFKISRVDANTAELELFCVSNRR